MSTTASPPADDLVDRSPPARRGTRRSRRPCAAPRPPSRTAARRRARRGAPALAAVAAARVLAAASMSLPRPRPEGRDRMCRSRRRRGAHSSSGGGGARRPQGTSSARSDSGSSSPVECNERVRPRRPAFRRSPVVSEEPPVEDEFGRTPGLECRRGRAPASPASSLASVSADRQREGTRGSRRGHRDIERRRPCGTGRDRRGKASPYPISSKFGVNSAIDRRAAEGTHRTRGPRPVAADGLTRA